LYVHYVVTSSISGAGTGNVWVEALQFAMMAAFVLFFVQLVVVSLVLACGPGWFWRRMVVYWGVVAWLAGSYGGSILLGYGLGRWLERWQTAGWFIHDSDSMYTWGAMFSVVASLPLILLGIQASFWFLRVVVGLRLQRTVAAEPNPSEYPVVESLSIRNLFESTAIVAVSLALLQMADQLSVSAQRQAAIEQQQLATAPQQMAMQQISEPKPAPGTYLFSMLAAAGYSAGGVFIAGVPFAMLFLSNVRMRLAWATTIGVTLFCTSAMALLTLMMGTGSEFWLVTTEFSFAFVVLFTSYSLALSLLRLYGWRLVGRKARALEPS
jgi:hypothetical protein